MPFVACGSLAKFDGCSVRIDPATIPAVVWSDIRTLIPGIAAVCIMPPQKHQKFYILCIAQRCPVHDCDHNIGFERLGSGGINPFRLQYNKEDRILKLTCFDYAGVKYSRAYQFYEAGELDKAATTITMINGLKL